MDNLQVIGFVEVEIVEHIGNNSFDVVFNLIINVLEIIAKTWIFLKPEWDPKD
jgi:hypothetical protein